MWYFFKVCETIVKSFIFKILAYQIKEKVDRQEKAEACYLGLFVLK